MLTSNQIRQRFLEFWTSPPRNSELIPNVSLVPNNDPTLLFVNSGMFPIVPYLGGEPHPLGKRLCNVQRCIRTIDIDEVGDYSHLVMFEMLGNWSLGDYDKKEQIPWMAELFIEQFKLDPKRLYASVWGGDESVPRDDEAIRIWKEVFAKYGIQAEFSEDITKIPGTLKEGENWKYRIFPYGKKDNWWQRVADVPGELGGPTSELFYDLGEIQYQEDKYHINDESGRFLEVGNSVFMEYRFGEDQKWHELKQQNVDFGGGFERIVTVVQGKNSVYETDLFQDTMKLIENLSGKEYKPDEPDSEETRAFRIVAEHSRSTVFILADGIKPGNKDQEYVLRRLIRRMVRYGMKLDIDGNFTRHLAETAINTMAKAYPHLEKNRELILSELEKEEIKFRKTISKGLKEMRKMIDSKDELDGQKAFHIYETYGFPLELTLEEFDMDEEQKARISKEFEQAKRSHQEKSRAGAQQKFAGGLADQSHEVTKLHTAHHLLLRALQTVLGEDVKQRGSNITGERLRIDFNYGEKLTPEQIKEVENIVNQKIEEGLPVIRKEMPKEEAEKLGAQMEFGQNYPDTVTVYFVGKSLEDNFSIEFCGGPHVSNTAEIGENGKRFKIVKEESSGAGIRRIKARLA